MSAGMEAVLVTLSGQVESGDAMTVTHDAPQVAGAYVSGGYAVICYTKCWPCQFGQHHTPPQWHTWADDDDIRHAVTTCRPDPSTSRCGCPCADIDAAQPDWGDDDEEDYSGPGEPESYTQEPCPVCDAEGACGWDADGRPLIHAVPVGEDS